MFENLPKTFIENLPAIAAIAAFLFTILEYVFDFKREKTSFGQYAKSFLRMGAALVTSMVFLFFIFAYWQPKDEWQIWKENTQSYFKSCVDKGTGAQLVAGKNEPANADKIASLEELRFQCLMLAWTNVQRPNNLAKRNQGGRHPQDNSDYTTLFWRDIYTAMLLNEIPGIPDTLRDTLSLYSNEYLGTGFTFPHKEHLRNGAPLFYAAGVREYLVKNLCLQPRGKECPPKRSPYERVWVWQFTQTELENLTRNKKMSEFVQALPAPDPALNSGQLDYKYYAKRVSRFGENNADAYDGYVLFRMSKFDRRFYRNTFGHPARPYAFFADIRDYWDLTWSQAVTMSATTPGASSSEDRWFIWIFVSDSTSSDTHYLASWGSVFEILTTNISDVNANLKKLTMN